MSFRHWFYGLALVLNFAAPPAHATTMVKPMTLDEVTVEARHVVHAVVTDVTSGRDEDGVPATWTTFAVAETLKGDDARTFTIKQFGVAAPLPDGTIAKLSGMPTYEVGEEVVLFLRGNSRRGFTSPVGLGQGTYRVHRRHDGRSEVRRDGDPQGSEDLESFVGKVKARAQRHE